MLCIFWWVKDMIIIDFRIFYNFHFHFIKIHFISFVYLFQVKWALHTALTIRFLLVLFFSLAKKDDFIIFCIRFQAKLSLFKIVLYNKNLIRKKVSLLLCYMLAITLFSTWLKRTMKSNNFVMGSSTSEVMFFFKQKSLDFDD